MSESMDYGLHLHAMVEEQIARRGLHDENVLSALRSVPRHLFVPEGAAHDAYHDSPLPIGYGQTICDRVSAKMGYAELVNQVKADFRTTDYYQGAYLINQAVNELCPAQIWQLRQSAAGYTGF